MFPNCVLVEVVTLLTWIALDSAKGNSASMGTTHGEMVVPKFFPRKGPRGTYSHAWMSRAESKHTNLVHEYAAHDEDQQLGPFCYARKQVIRMILCTFLNSELF